MRPEILAPAGSMDALKAAVHAGADAVYLGGDRFGARAYAGNFDTTALVEAISYCHLYGVKVYLTINTLFRNEEIEELGSYLLPLYEEGLDAVIVQDFGVMKYVHEMFPNMAIHGSTQMTITTAAAYNLLKDYGVTRIVPARELSIEEIASLKSGEWIPEVEVFVQGALCYCYSGQCLMSSMLGGRSGNRGRCAQTCRLPYTLYDEDGTVIETAGEYVLSPKDLCGLEAIPDLIKTGVDSFKIEGRMKRPEYVAACVRAYRTLVDFWYEREFSDTLVEQYKSQMASVFNRGGFTKGYYHQKNGKDMMSVKTRGNVGITVGKIASIHRNQISVLLEQNICKGDILTPYDNNENTMLTSNVEGRSGEQIVLNVPKAQKLYVGQKINRIFHAPLMEELQQYVTKVRKVALRGNIYLNEGAKAVFTVECEIAGQLYTGVCEGEVVEQASTKPLTKEIVFEKTSKTGGTRYYFEELDIYMDESVFYPVKELKSLRRGAIAALEEAILLKDRRKWIEKKMEPVSDKEKNQQRRTVVMVSSKEQYDIVCEKALFESVYVDMQYFSREQLRTFENANSMQQLYLVLPPIIRGRYFNEIKQWIDTIDLEVWCGIVIRNIDELAMLKAANFKGKIVADYSLYAMNDWSAAFMREVFPEIQITLPVELNEQQIRGLQYSHSNTELVVYGYQQLMVSQQCVRNTVQRCNGENKSLRIKDRYFKNFFILSVCKYCYNLIYNGIPTVLYDLTDKAFLQGVSERIHFTRENAHEVKMVLEAYGNGHVLEGEKTRGHYKRGVE